VSVPGIHGARTTAWPGPERLLSHEPSDALAPARVARIADVAQDAARPIGAIAHDETRAHVHENPGVHPRPLAVLEYIRTIEKK